MLRLWIGATYLHFLFSQVSWSLRPYSPQCYFDYRLSERPFIHAVSKSLDESVHVFAAHESIVGRLASRTTTGNFTIDDRDPALCTVPKTGIYVIMLQVTTKRIRIGSTPTVHIGVGKISERSGFLEEHAVARSYLANTFAGDAFCANLTTLFAGEQLFVTIDSYVDVAFERGLKFPIQLVAYLVSPRSG